MRLTLACIIIAVAASGALAFDFGLVGGQDWTNLAKGTSITNSYIVGTTDPDVWWFQWDDPDMWFQADGGPLGAGDWFAQHSRWSDDKLIQVANTPPIGTTVQLSYDYIQQDGFPDRGVFINGVSIGDSISPSGGSDPYAFGTNLAAADGSSALPTSSTWVEGETLTAFIDSNYDNLAVLLVQAGSNEGSLRGFDNVELTVIRVAGDGNNDGVTDDADYTIWADNYLATGVGIDGGDFNGDGTVDDADYTIWADNYGAALATVPEPATMGLLGLGAWALLRRRK